MYQMPQRIPGGSLLEVQNYEFNFTVPQGSTEWIDQSIGVEVPPGGTRLVVSVASWRIDIGSLESKVWQFGVRAFANPNQFPWITASIVLQAYTPTDPPALASNPWSGWVNVQVLIFA